MYYFTLRVLFVYIHIPGILYEKLKNIRNISCEYDRLND